MAQVTAGCETINFSENEDMYKAASTARQALLRITTHLRTAQGVAISEPSTQCSLVKSDGSDITYKYDSSDDTLYLVTNDDLTDSDYTLCKNVTPMTFTRSAVPDEPTRIRNVQMSMTVLIGNAAQTISTASVIRKNL